MKKGLFIAAVCWIGTLIANEALAVTQSITANIRFDAALSLSAVTNINFGSVIAAQAGTYTISPDGAVTASESGQWLGGASNAGSLTISGSTTQGVDISTANYVASNGVTPSQATCRYDNGSTAPCQLTNQPPPGAGKQLLIGVTVTADGTQNIGTNATPTFDVIVTYH